MNENHGERCFACGKALGKNPRVVITCDGGQLPWVGRDCYAKVKAAGDAGWQPRHGRPRLFLPPSIAKSQAAIDAKTKRAICAIS